MTTVPDGLPTLSSGSHGRNSGKACVMEYVSVLTGDRWTDFPACTNPVIARVAQIVNDTLSNEDRHLLVPYIDRLMAASGSNARFEKFCLDFLDVSFRAELSGTLQAFRKSVGREPQRVLASYVGMAIQNRFWPYALSSGDTTRALWYLDNFLKAHEELVGRREFPRTTPEALADARRLIETKSLIPVGA